MLSCVRFLWPVLRCPSLAGFGVYPEELIPAAGGNLTVFRTFPINSGSPKVERAFLMVHGVLGIPAKVNAHSDGKVNSIPGRR